MKKRYRIVEESKGFFAVQRRYFFVYHTIWFASNFEAAKRALLEHSVGAVVVHEEVI